jgi:hypothetical protein
VHLADKSEYIEAHSSDGSGILEAIHYMIKHEEMPEKKLKVLRQNMHSTGSNQPASAGHSGARTPIGSIPSASTGDFGSGDVTSPRTLGSGVSSAIGSSSAGQVIAALGEAKQEWVKIYPTLDVRDKKRDVIRWHMQARTTRNTHQISPRV